MKKPFLDYFFNRAEEKISPSHELNTKKNIQVPPSVDLGALWEEPQDPSYLSAILSGITLAVSIIAMFILIFKH